MPQPDAIDLQALRLALSHIDSTASLMQAEIAHLQPDRWPRALVRLRGIAQTVREEAGAMRRLLEGQEAAHEPGSLYETQPVDLETGPEIQLPPGRTYEQTVMMRAQ